MERQEMAGLEVRAVPNGYDPLVRQAELQEIIGRRLPGAVVARRAATNAELAEIVTANVFAIQMELAELVERLNWKWWRDYGALDENPPDETVLLESAFEAIDVQHFLNNVYLALGLTWQQVLSMYEAKQQENRARQGRGY